MRVAVLRGGRSSEHDVSLRSGAAVAVGLAAAGHEVVDLVIDRDGRFFLQPEADEVSLRAGGGLLGVDCAFGVLHGPFGEDGTIQGLLTYLDVPYVGPDVLAAAVTLDKLTCKRLLGAAGLPQVGFCDAASEQWRSAPARFGLPLWVKPSRLGSSVGITRVDRAADLEGAVATARRYDPRVLIEQHCEGREIEVSVLGNADPEVSLPGEIALRREGSRQGGDWYDYEAKYSQGAIDLIVPAPIDPRQTAAIRRIAAEVFLTLGCSGLARCDFFLAADGSVLVNEINTIPGFTETSVYAKLFEASGITYPELCDRLVELALARYEATRGHLF